MTTATYTCPKAHTAMLRYRITLTVGPNAGYSTTTEMNEAAALNQVARGYRVELLGPSLITVVDEASPV